MVLFSVCFFTVFPKTSLVNPVVAKTAMGKPLFKASEGGRVDILRGREDVIQSELQQGAGT
jgi:hypothetical protein